MLLSKSVTNYSRSLALMKEQNRHQTKDHNQCTKKNKSSCCTTFWNLLNESVTQSYSQKKEIMNEPQCHHYPAKKRIRIEQFVQAKIHQAVIWPEKQSIVEEIDDDGLSVERTKFAQEEEDLPSCTIIKTYFVDNVLGSGIASSEENFSIVKDSKSLSWINQDLDNARNKALAVREALLVQTSSSAASLEIADKVKQHELTSISMERKKLQALPAHLRPWDTDVSSLMEAHRAARYV